MAVTKRGGNWYIYFRPFKEKKVGIKLDVTSKTEAKGIEAMLIVACRTGNYSGLGGPAREVCIRMFVNQKWELPSGLGGGTVLPETPKEELTIWRAVELCLKYPGIRESANRERMEQAFAHIVGHFGKNARVQDIWIPQIKEYQIVRSHEGAAPATINREKASLSRLFQVLIEMRYVEVNPCRQVEPLSEKESQREVYISSEDFTRILACLPEWFQPIAQTAYFTGMRKGEVLALTRDRVQLNRRMIILGSEHTKEGHKKRVPIHNELLPILQHVMQVSSMETLSVFHREGVPITHKDQVRWCWERRVTQIGFDNPPHFHDLRHTWKTNARRSGMHPEIEMAIMGHSERGKSVHEGYGRISDAELLQAIDLMTFDHGETEIWAPERRNPVAATTGSKRKW